MKKVYGLLAILGCALLLTGCGGGKTYVCTAKITENGVTYEGKITAKLDKDDKVEGYDIELTFEDEESAKQTVALYEWVDSMAENDDEKINAKRSGKTVTVKNAEKLAKTTGETSYIGLTKEEFKKVAEQNSDGATFECK